MDMGMSDAAEAYHSEFWWWIWHGKDADRTIADKKAELRAKYGEAAEREVVTKLRELGFLPATQDTDSPEAGGITLTSR